MRKKLCIVFILLAVVTLGACGQNSEGESNQSIAVIGREQGSGTRDAMESMLDLNTNEENQNTDTVIIRDGNGAVASQVMDNTLAMGYVSFATVTEHADSLKGLYINGIAPTAENILNGSYEISRDFDMIFPEEELSELQIAFIEFMKSIEGLQALESADTIVSFDEAEAFDMAAYEGLTGVLTLGGSTSTERSVSVVKEQFMAMFPQVSISYHSVGSGAGIQGAQDGRFDIGFSSRSVLDSELETGFTATTICREGIVFIVHPDRAVTDLTIEQIRDIYLGNITLWDEIE